MSSPVAMIVLLLLLVVMAAAVSEPPAAPAPASGSIEVAGERRPSSLVPFRPRRHGGGWQPVFRRAGGGCMPRGFHVPPSAPSRYVNYHTLDTGVCAHGPVGRKP